MPAPTYIGVCRDKADPAMGIVARNAGELMRIISGQWRSRRLIRPSSTTTRPMPDRVKEAVFDMLGSYYNAPGMLPAVDVADVFAGGGSLGLEAMSRGAASCCFFERDRAALVVLRKNLDALHVGPEASIVARDAWKYAVATPDKGPFDLVLLDPPYADSEDTSDNGAVRRYFKRFDQVDGHKPLIVLHHHTSVRFAPGAEDSWSILKQRTFGTNGVTVFQL